MFPGELVQICSMVMRNEGPEGTQIQEIADRLIQYARMCMINRTRTSPFESRFLVLVCNRYQSDVLQLHRNAQESTIEEG